MVQPKKKQEITVTFRSKEAKVLVALIVARLTDTLDGREATRSLKVSAIGKYPFVTLDQPAIDFETLLVGKQQTREVTICNSSQVPTSFNIERTNDDGKDAGLTLSHTSGELGPGATSTIVVTYTPRIPEVISCAYFRVTTRGGNELKFHCKGQAAGYDVDLSSRSLHFGEVQIETETNRILNVINESDLPTQFQFVTDPNNLFSFSQNVGTVKPHSATRIIVNFSPRATGNYYERVFCIVRNHRVLNVDLMGTCFDILTKPVPLTQRHVDVYRHKVIMGALNKLAAKKSDPYGSQSSVNESVDLDYQLEIPIDDPSQVILHKEMLQSSAAEQRDLHLSADNIDFAFAHSGRVSEAKQITLHNKFCFPVRVDWTLLEVTDKTTNKKIRNPFNVSPAQCEVAANGQATFNVDFAPYEPDSYFFQLAQCYVHLLNGNQFKTKQLLSDTVAADSLSRTKTANKTLLGSMKKSKYVDFSSEEVDPPVCLSVRLCGHSFAPGS